MPRAVRRVLGLVLVCVPAWLAAACGSTSTSARPAERLDLSRPWATAAPDDVGVDASGLEAAAAHAATIPRFRSLLVARRGRLVFERYFAGAGAATRFDVRSVTKSVVSALVGIALRDGALPNPDATIAAYLEPPYALDAAGRSITVRHLLTMTSGFAWDEETGPDYGLWIRAPDHVQYLLDRPHASAPGERFTYDSAAVHVLGVVVQRAAGMPLPQYADDHLFRFLGAAPVGWEPLEAGTVNGGAGIQLRGRDLVALGQLFLQRGWSGQQSVVPEAWVDQATSAQFTWRTTFGPQQRLTYGFLWWVADAAPAAFFAWGYGGQFVYVVPGKDLVVVTTTEWRDITETTQHALEQQVLGVVVDDVVPSAR